MAKGKLLMSLLCTILFQVPAVWEYYHPIGLTSLLWPLFFSVVEPFRLPINSVQHHHHSHRLTYFFYIGRLGWTCHCPDPGMFVYSCILPIWIHNPILWLVTSFLLFTGIGCCQPLPPSHIHGPVPVQSSNLIHVFFSLLQWNHLSWVR